MSLTTQHGAALAGALAVAFGSGCFVDTSPPGGVAPGAPTSAPTGTLTIDWTVSGLTSPGQCGAFNAQDLELAVYDRAGVTVTVVDADCSAFTVTVPLSPGDYTANATLVDARSSPVSRTLPLRDLHITANSDLAIDANFPAGSRL